MSHKKTAKHLSAGRIRKLNELRNIYLKSFISYDYNISGVFYQIRS